MDRFRALKALGFGFPGSDDMGTFSRLRVASMGSSGEGEGEGDWSEALAAVPSLLLRWKEGSGGDGDNDAPPARERKLAVLEGLKFDNNISIEHAKIVPGGCTIR